MFRRCNVTQEISAAGSGYGTSDGRRNVVVSRRNVRDNGTQHIEGGIVANTFFHDHIGGNLVHGHMARTFHHYLDILLPGSLGEIPQFN